MARLVLTRLAAAIPVMGMVALIVFSLLRLTPGDPAAILAGDNATSAQIAEIRAGLGLDRALPVQFLSWAGQLLQGDLGQSFFFKAPVAELIGQRMGPTLALAAYTLLLTIVLAVPMGAWAAWAHGTLADRLLMGFSVLGFSVPVFVLGYALIYLFAIELRWLPVQGYQPLSAGLLPFLRQLTLPACTLAIVYVALVARVTRTSLLEVLGQDHVRSARARGLAESLVVLRHGLRNAAVPIVTVIGLGIAALIGGVVVTESVFNIPGLGRLTVDAVLARDYPTIQGIILVFSGIYVGLNLLIDLTYPLLDPRIRT